MCFRKILIVVLGITFFSFGETKAGIKIVPITEWNMLYGYPESNFHTQNILQFIDDVKKTTSVNIIKPTTLQKLNTVKTKLNRNEVPIGEIRLGIYGNEDPMYILDGLPEVAQDINSAWLLKEIQMEYLQNKFSRKGLMILYSVPWPGQGFYTKFPVNKVSDFFGKKLRTYSSVTNQLGSALGFNAEILPFKEIPYAFSTGRIEALFTSPQTGIDIQAWNNTKHFTYTGSIFSKNAVIVSKKAFKTLSKSQQKKS